MKSTVNKDGVIPKGVLPRDEGVIPKGVLPKFTKKEIDKKLYRYGIVVVLLLELLSVGLKAIDLYSVYTYILITQLACAILVYNNLYANKAKKLCVRKRIAFKILLSYYLIGGFCLVFSISNYFYDYIVNPLLLGSALLLILYTIRNE